LIDAARLGILCVLICYCSALYFLVPSFNPEILNPSFSNLAKYSAITYGLGTFSTYFSRIFYVSNVSFKYELIMGVFVTFGLFTFIGPPVLVSP